eukprot:gene18260-biopygen23408
MSSRARAGGGHWGGREERSVGREFWATRCAAHFSRPDGRGRVRDAPAAILPLSAAIPGTFGAWPPPPGPPGSPASPGAQFCGRWLVMDRGVPDLFQHLFGDIGIRSLPRGAGTGPARHEP